MIIFGTEMPVVLKIRGYRFSFFSNEGMEPKHVHIEKAEANGKVWLEPSIRIEYLYGFTVSEQKEVIKIINDHVELLRNRWNEYFGKQF